LIFIEHSGHVWYNYNSPKKGRRWRASGPRKAQQGTKKSIILHHKSQVFKYFGELMTKKAPFCASLRLTITVFTRLMKKAVSMALCTMASLCGKSSLLEQSLSRTPSQLKTSVISVAKNPFNQCNLRLINDLRSTKDYVRKNKLFLQNEPNFPDALMNVTNLLTTNYEQLTMNYVQKNKPNTNPIKPNTKPIKAYKMPKQTQNKANTNPNKANFKGKKCCCERFQAWRHERLRPGRA